jgi:excisionase family DNA binding protein
MTERLLTSRELGEWLGVPASWIAREAREGRMPCVRLGKYVRFEREAVELWLKKQRSGEWRAPDGEERVTEPSRRHPRRVL